MSDILKIFHNGIYGYAPEGSVGESGESGYSVYYAPYSSSNDDKERILDDIRHGRVFSNNPNYIKEDDAIKYKISDTIITNDSSIFVISGSETPDTSIDLTLIGSIKLIGEFETDGIDIFNGKDIVYNIVTGEYTAENDYNYIEGGCSPLFHHRDTNDPSVYGNYIELSQNDNMESIFRECLSKMDGEMCTFVINFSNTLRIEKIINSDNLTDKIFIDNRYLYPYGSCSDASIWKDTSIISSYENEKDSSTSLNLRSNLLTDNNKCLCEGYITFTHNNDEYRKDIKITDQLNVN